MSMKVRERDGNTYLYFQEKDGKTNFLGKIGEITKYSNRTIKAYGEISKKYSKYLDDTIKLISILPDSERKRQSSKLIKELEKQLNYISSLSPSVAKQYKPKGQVKAEEETRRRQEQLEEITVEIVKELQKDHTVYAKTLIEQFGATKNEIKKIFLFLYKYESIKDNVHYNKSEEYLEPLKKNDVFTRLAKDPEKLLSHLRGNNP